MSPETWAAIHTYGLVFSAGIFVGAGAMLLAFYLKRIE